MWPNPQFPADLVTFTEEILNAKLNFLCSVTCLASHKVLPLCLVFLIGSYIVLRLLFNIYVTQPDHFVLLFSMIERSLECQINVPHPLVNVWFFFQPPPSSTPPYPPSAYLDNPLLKFIYFSKYLFTHRYRY